MRWCNIAFFFLIGLISRLWTHNREYHPVFQLGNLHILEYRFVLLWARGKPVDNTAATYFFQRWRCDINDHRVLVLLQSLYRIVEVYECAKQKV